VINVSLYVCNYDIIKVHFCFNSVHIAFIAFSMNSVNILINDRFLCI